MPKQSDLTREGDLSQETPKTNLKIPVPTREQISSALRKTSQRTDEAPPSESDPVAP